MSAHIEQASVLSGRSMVMAVTIGLHVLVVGALMTMRIDMGQVAQDVRLILALPAVEPPADPPPPAPVPEVGQSRIAFVPSVLPQPVFPDETLQRLAFEPLEVGPPGGIVAGDERPDGRAAVMPATALVFRAVRSTDEYYPAASIQLEEQGAAIVRICVGPTGRLEGVPIVEATSGSRRLDQAAVRWASEALRFTPATRDGMPVSACKGFRVNFALR